MIKFNCPHCQQSLRVPVSRADTEATCPGCHAQLRVPPAVAAEDSGVLTAPPVVSQPPEFTAPPVVTEDPTLVDLSVMEIPESGLESDLNSLDVLADAEGNLASIHEEVKDDSSPFSKENDAVSNNLLEDRRRRVEVSSKVFDDLADRVSKETAADSKILSNRRAHGQLGVSRSNLYMFAALILFVAITSFWLGTMMSLGSKSQVETEIAGVDDYVNFEGRVTFRTDNDPEAIDEMALVMLLPEDSLPSEKFVENGIAAGVPLDESLPSVLEIRRLGGDITMAGVEGQFAMKIASGHRYYLLVVSALKPAEKEPGDQELEELGRYFGSPARLLDGKFYRWSLEVVNTNRDVRVYHR